MSEWSLLVLPNVIGGSSLMSKTTKRIRHHRVFVLELGDVVPRRHPMRPNLCVGVSVLAPEKQLEVELKRKRPRWYSGAIIRDRPDLAPKRHFSSSETAARACERLIRRLQREGYTVNRESTVWSVYVIELDPSAVSNPGKGFVYVGETSLSPEERFKQHVGGKRNERGPLFARVVYKHGVRLRDDLAPRRKFFDQASARRAEKQRFEILKSRGFNVRGGH
jgi:hypothetical protein